jgi:transposase
MDGSKFRAVSRARSVREREAVKRYLEELETRDAQEEVVIDPRGVASVLEKLRQHPEPEARFMRTPNGKAPAYNVQTAVDAEHALLVAEQVTDEATDNRSLQPMAEAAQAAVGEPTQSMNVVVDAGYSNSGVRFDKSGSARLSRQTACCCSCVPRCSKVSVSIV